MIIYCKLMAGLPQLRIRLVQHRNIPQIFFSLGQWTEAAEDTDAALHVLVERRIFNGNSWEFMGSHGDS